MPALERLQSGFLGALLGTDPAPELGPSRIDPARSWEIYRNNYRSVHAAALADTYGSVRALVGDACFAQLARQYVVQHASTSGDLNDYGAQFPAFLERAGSVADLPYLPDIARLDWAWLDVLRAPWEPGDWLAALLRRPPGQWHAARVAPAARLVRSAWPIHAVWMVAHGEAPAASLDQGAQAVLVSRTSAVHVSALDEPEARFAERWLGGARLDEAFDAAIEAGRFELPDFLLRLATLGAVERLA